MRLTQRIVLCLLIGAALNVGVAWAIAYDRSSIRDYIAILVEQHGEGDGVRDVGYRVWTVDHPGESIESITRIRSGWPIPAMERQLRWHPSPPLPAWMKERNLRFTRDRSSDHDAIRVRGVLLPIRPTAGVGVNTIVFATGVWATLVGMRSVMSWNRRRRGLCGVCRYDMAGVDGVCPECGAVR